MKICAAGERGRAKRVGDIIQHFPSIRASCRGPKDRVSAGGITLERLTRPLHSCPLSCVALNDLKSMEKWLTSTRSLCFSHSQDVVYINPQNKKTMCLSSSKVFLLHQITHCLPCMDIWHWLRKVRKPTILSSWAALSSFWSKNKGDLKSVSHTGIN